VGGKSNILITGGAGFIGLALAKYLSDRSHKVIIFDNLSRGKFDNEFKEILKKRNISFFRVDLKNKIRIRLKNLSHIFHLAGSVGVKNINRDSYGSFINNIIALKNVIEMSKPFQRHVKLILFSTSEVYSTIIKNKIVKFPIGEKNNILIENNIIKRDAYFLSKIFNEKLLQLSNFNHIILRPHNIYGPRMGFSHVIPELIKKMILEKRKITRKTIVNSPNHKRAFCYIDDAVLQIIKLSLNSKINKEIFNIGNMKEEISMIEVANRIRKLIYKKSKIKKGNNTLGSPIRRVPDMKKTIKYSRIKNFTSFDEGLKKTVRWYLNNI